MSLNRVCGVYQIQSLTEPDRIYVGGSHNIKQRSKEHLAMLQTNRHHSPKLQNHYNKYGEQDLCFSVLCVCDEDDLLLQEQYYITTLKPWFNISLIAGLPPCRTHTPETIQKIRDARKKMVFSEESIKKRAKSIKEHWAAEENKPVLIEAHKKISKSLKKFYKTKAGAKRIAELKAAWTGELNKKKK